MSQRSGGVLFAGSVPGENAEEVMRMCAAATGNYVTSLSDGETGNRQQWIQFLASNIYDKHPSLETIQRPEPVNGRERWHNESYGEKGWLFKVNEDVTEIALPALGYAAAAKASYLDFVRLKEEGVIPAHVKFQVSLPLTESATRIFLTNDRDFKLMQAAYETAIGNEIADMLTTIPAGDLVIQWDLALEVLYILMEGKTPWAPEGKTMDRYLSSLTNLAKLIPDETLMGCHFCYGDLGHKHLMEPADLGLLVSLANASVNAVSRHIDYIHMPVPLNRSNEAYFAPLKDLQTGDTKLYLGLIHYTDGVEGSLKRVAFANQYASGFGIATTCGFGRRSRDTIPELLRIHSAVAETLQ